MSHEHLLYAWNHLFWGAIKGREVVCVARGGIKEASVAALVQAFNHIQVEQRYAEQLRIKHTGIKAGFKNFNSKGTRRTDVPVNMDLQK
jgi:hypothetical protein